MSKKSSLKSDSAIDKRADLERAINATLLITHSKGGDLPASVTRWAVQYLDALADSGVSLECQELLRAECKKTPLASVLYLGQLLASVPATHDEAFGGTERLDHFSGELEACALLFDGLTRSETVESLQIWPFEEWIPAPHKMAEQLRRYQLVAKSLPATLNIMNIRSGRDIERLLPTGYVKSATGGWHDREVAALIEAATGNPLDEGAQRVWRFRNFKAMKMTGELVWQIAEILEERHDSASKESQIL
jgi:hypothetical protein